MDMNGKGQTSLGRAPTHDHRYKQGIGLTISLWCATAAVMVQHAMLIWSSALQERILIHIHLPPMPQELQMYQARFPAL